MNCPQCNTSLPDSATFCYKCGTSTRSTTFSYLPEGAPPWPTTAPQSPFYPPEATSQVLAQDGEKDVVSHLYQAGEDLEGASAMEGKREPQQHLYRWMAIISLFLDVVGLAVVFGLGRWLAFSLACPFHVPWPVDNLWIRVICLLAVYVPSFLAMILGIIAGYKVRTRMMLTCTILGIVLFFIYVGCNPWVEFLLFFTDGAASC